MSTIALRAAAGLLCALLLLASCATTNQQSNAVSPASSITPSALPGSAATLPPASPTTDTRVTATAIAARTAAAVAQQQAATASIVAATATEIALVAGAKQLFREEFADNRNAWFTGTFGEREQNSIENGVFRVVHTAAGASYELYQMQSLNSFVVEVDCLVAQGGAQGSCGLVFGAQQESGRWAFDLFADYYRLTLIEGQNGITVLEGSPGAAVKRDDWNRLRVVRRGDQIRLYLNDQFLRAVADTRRLEGFVGLATSAYQPDGGGTVELQLDNFMIYALQ